MTCPHCGAELPASARQCIRCSGALDRPVHPEVVTGVLTPPPMTAQMGGLTEALPARESGPSDEDITRLGASSAAAAAGSATGPLTPGQQFGTRYHIIRLLGIGGMGAVYHAWDQELGVAVAIKVVRPEVTADPAAAQEIERRFKRELLLAREVTHKNVVRIHDLGEISGIKYITMSYVEGQDLATVLKQTGKMPVSAALHIARQAVAGLQAAHEAGVVHRDLKPANIMIEQDRALIMDFGIARSSGREAAVPSAPSTSAGPPGVTGFEAGQTVAGTIVGTVEYMAPEQAKGEPVDQRADLYAFGLILYDMLLGGRQVVGARNAVEELRQRMQQSPPALRSLDASIPETLERIVSRCLEPDPAARYQTTAELAADLDRLDEEGNLRPLVRRLTPRLMAAAAVLVIAMLAGTYYVTRRAVEPPKQHDPVSVVIADLDNQTKDPTFDRTLEPMLKQALEGAGFISAYDRSAIIRTLGVRPAEKLDETAARELAVKQGLGVVLSGSIGHQGSGYALSVKAAQTVTGNVIASATGRASSKDQVLGAATRLVARVREALGDETTSDSAQRFAMETLSATSLDVVRDYARAMEALSNSQFAEALLGFSKAVDRDRDFGLAYAGMAIASRNLDRQQDAEKYVKEAVRHLDGMTERERYRTRGLFYMVTSDYQACVKEYGDLIARYAGDAAARNNLALCSTYLRNMPKALEEMRQVVKILPRRALYRENLALYATYAGDFQAGEREAQAMQAPGVFGLLALAFAQLGQGQLPRATDTYQKLAQVDAQGASYAASGLADLAIYEGRPSDAVRLLGQGAVADLKSKDSDRAAAKFAALAHAELLRGRKRAAIEAVEEALTNSKAVKIRFLAARSLVEAGETARARPLIADLASELQAEPQAYAKIVDGEAALKNGDPRRAIKLLTEANGLLDTWIGHFDLGLAYLDAGAFTQADSEFDRCINRRGEALSLFLDEEPTYGHFPPVYYYQGRVREGLNSAGFAESYRAYLAIRGKSNEDPLLPDVRRRAGGG